MTVPTRWLKILKDTWSNRSRSLLVVLSIAVGVAAVGMINHSALIVRRDLFGAHAQGNPVSLQLSVSPFQKELTSAVEAMREVAAAQARRVERAEIQTAQGAWVDLTLNAFPNFKELKVNRVNIISGRADLEVREIVLERQSAQGLGLGLGDVVRIDMGEEREFELEVVGIGHDLYTMPYSLMGEVSGYIALDTLVWMGEGYYFNQLDIVVQEHLNDRESVLHVGDLIRDRVIEPGGHRAVRVEIPGIGSEPGRHWGEDAINGFLLILQVMGVMAILLSSGLVVNTVSAMLVQQIKQIGIMRSMGANRNQIIGMYFFNVLVFSVLGLTIAIPAGVLGAWWLADFAADFVNFDLSSVGIPLSVLLLQVALGLFMPLGIALIPILRGTRMTIYEAIYQYGIGGSEQQGWLGRALLRVRALAPPIALALRNTFRNKSRLTFTLITLTLAGAMFIAVFSTRASLSGQLSEIARYVQFDVALSLPAGSRVHTVEREAARISGVQVAEGWAHGLGVIEYKDGHESGQIEIVGLSHDAVTIDPLMEAGRWLGDGDTWQVVVNDDLLDEEPGIEVGSELTLKVGQRERNFQVVGVTSKHLSGPRVYMPFRTFGQLTNRPNQVDTIRVLADENHISAKGVQETIAAKVETRFENAGLSKSKAITHHAIFGDFTTLFNLILFVLIIMAGILATVGGLGLTGSLGINVLERTREIGVLRAVGASNIAVRKVILVEGLVVGLLSWVLGAILSGPAGRALAAAVIQAVMRANLSFRYSFEGLLLWLVVVGLIGVLASMAPARRAAKLTVREVLDYE